VLNAVGPILYSNIRFDSLTLLIPITVYTIYFHLEYIVPTASEKDNMAISYLTLNTISTKPVSPIAVSSISDDYCFPDIIYYTHYPCLYSTTTSQLNILLYTGIHHPSTPYRICELCVLCYCLQLHDDIIVPITLYSFSLYCVIVFVHTILSAVCSCTMYIISLFSLV